MPAMAELLAFADGGYAFLKGGFPYSQGVRAANGYAVERVRFARPMPLAQGFAAIEAHLARRARPQTALCAAELRSPKPFSMTGFSEFNREYVAVLERWGLLRDGVNPVARSNVAPQIDPPAQPSLYAFCYTVPSDYTGPSEQPRPSFVVAGSGEWPEGGRFPEDIAARGDLSTAGIAAKARCVLDAMQRRLAGLGVTWQDVTATQVYTVHDIHAALAEQILPRAGNGGGLTWHYCRPPIEELEFEMDLRGVALERVLVT
jgi:hypothetical protein